MTADGREHLFDVIIFATGSNVAEHGVGVNIGLKGQEDVDLQTYWKRIGGPQAYLGTSVPGVSLSYRFQARGGWLRGIFKARWEKWQSKADQARTDPYSTAPLLSPAPVPKLFRNPRP